MNSKKTKIMHIKGTDDLLDDLTEIVVNITILEKVQHFKYLGSKKSSDGTCLKDVMTRVAMEKAKMKNIRKDIRIAINLKLKVPHLARSYVWVSAWSLRKKEGDKLKATEMWLYRQS